MLKPHSGPPRKTNKVFKHWCKPFKQSVGHVHGTEGSCRLPLSEDLFAAQESPLVVGDEVAVRMARLDITESSIPTTMNKVQYRVGQCFSTIRL